MRFSSYVYFEHGIFQLKMVNFFCHIPFENVFFDRAVVILFPFKTQATYKSLEIEPRAKRLF